jgi:hypothetical protein
MSPQPLSRVKPRTKVLASPDAIILRPQLAPLIAEIIARWADIEANVGSILAYLLRAEAGPTVAMLGAIRSASAQMDMIAAAGARKLVDPELEVFEAVLKMARSAAYKRNRIAHHIWAHSEELPDALLLIEPAAYLDIFVAVSESMDEPSAEPNDPRFEPDESMITVYREGDFFRIIAELKIVAKCTTFLINYLVHQDEAKDRIYGWLFAEPLFETALKAIRKARPPIPEPLQQA